MRLLHTIPGDTRCLFLKRYIEHFVVAGPLVGGRELAYHFLSLASTTTNHEKASATTKWQDLHADEPKTILEGMQKGAEGESLGQVVFWTHDTHLSQIGNTSLDHLVCIINMLGITVLGVGEEISHL